MGDTETLTQTVVQSEHLAEGPAAWLADRCRLIVCAHDDTGFDTALHDADGLVVRTYTRVDDALLDRAPRLRVVGRAGAGLDNVDVAACRRRGVEVVYTPDANTQAVVEYVIRLLTDHLRPAIMLGSPASDSQWRALRAEHVGARELADLTLGVLGLGRIGKRLAEVAGALRMRRVTYHDLVEIPPEQRFGATPVDVETLFSASDIVSVHVDGRAENRGFVDERLIRLMKPDVVFLNTARGFVVDNLSLAAFLREHPAATALLDVHEPEPFGADYPLLGLGNACLLPHLASRTRTALDAMSWVVRDVVAVLQGRAPRYPAPG